MSHKISLLNIGCFNKEESPWFYHDIKSIHAFLLKYPLVSINSFYYEDSSDRSQEIQRKIKEWKPEESVVLYILCLTGHGNMGGDLDWHFLTERKTIKSKIEGKEIIELIRDKLQTKFILMVNSCFAYQNRMKIALQNIDGKFTTLEEPLLLNRVIKIGDFKTVSTSLFNHSINLVQKSNNLYSSSNLDEKSEPSSGQSNEEPDENTTTVLEDRIEMIDDVNFICNNAVKQLYIFSFSTIYVKAAKNPNYGYMGNFFNILSMMECELSISKIYLLAIKFFTYANYDIRPQMSVFANDLSKVIVDYELYKIPLGQHKDGQNIYIDMLVNNKDVIIIDEPKNFSTRHNL